MKIIGRTHKFGDLINTDIHCSSKYLPPGSSEEEIIANIFSELRASFFKMVINGDILVAGKGFGTVSSREEAPTLLKRIGIHAVLADSFGYLFYRNAINVGLPLLECDTVDISDNDRLEVDLSEGTVVNLTTGKKIQPKGRYSLEILNILEDGGLINHILKHGGYQV